MSDRAELLIGGWIAGTLTPGERRELLDAAMANQALFDTLADEEGMRELLADPAVRRELSALLARPQASAPARDSWWGWMRHPGSLAAVGVAAVLLVGLVALRPGLTERAMEATQLPTAAKTAPAAAPQTIGATAAEPEKAERATESRRQRDPSPKVTAPPAPVAVNTLEKVQPQALGGTAAAEARNEAGSARPRLEMVGPEPRLAMTPPPVAAGSPAAVLTPAAPAPPSEEAKKTKRETAASAESVAVLADSADLVQVAPISYRVERQTAEGGAWTPVAGGTMLRTGDRARLAITAAQAGTVQIKAGSEDVTVRAAAGEVILYPPTGALAAERGERSIAVSFLSVAPPALLETQSAAPAGAVRRRQVQEPVSGSKPYNIAVQITYR